MFVHDSPFRVRGSGGYEGEGIPLRRPLHGFTLVELLVVVTVMSVLASLLLPTMSRALESARQVHCANNQKQVHLGMVMYADDFRGCLPPLMEGKLPWTGGGLDYITWFHRIGDTPHYGGVYSGGYIPYTTFRCPKGVAAQDTYPERESDFGMNMVIADAYTYGAPAPDNTYRPPIRMNTVDAPSRLYLLLDSQNGNKPIERCKKTSTTNSHFIADRHGLGDPVANILFLDGHSDALSFLDMPKGTQSGGVYSLPWGPGAP